MTKAKVCGKRQTFPRQKGRWWWEVLEPSLNYKQKTRAAIIKEWNEHGQRNSAKINRQKDKAGKAAAAGREEENHEKVRKMGEKWDDNGAVAIVITGSRSWRFFRFFPVLFLPFSPRSQHDAAPKYARTRRCPPFPRPNKMWIKCHGISQLQRQLNFSIDQTRPGQARPVPFVSAPRLSLCPRPNTKTGHFNRPHLRRKFVEAGGSDPEKGDERQAGAGRRCGNTRK